MRPRPVSGNRPPAGTLTSRYPGSRRYLTGPPGRPLAGNHPTARRPPAYLESVRPQCPDARIAHFWAAGRFAHSCSPPCALARRHAHLLWIIPSGRSPLHVPGPITPCFQAIGVLHLPLQHIGDRSMPRWGCQGNLTIFSGLSERKLSSSRTVSTGAWWGQTRVAGAPRPLRSSAVGHHLLIPRTTSVIFLPPMPISTPTDARPRRTRERAIHPTERSLTRSYTLPCPCAKADVATAKPKSSMVYPAAIRQFPAQWLICMLDVP